MCAASKNCEKFEIDQDNLRMKFLALNADFSSPSADPPIDSRRPFHASIEEGYPSKNGYFTDIALSSMKTIADGHKL